MPFELLPQVKYDGHLVLERWLPRIMSLEQSNGEPEAMPACHQNWFCFGCISYHKGCQYTAARWTFPVPTTFQRQGIGSWLWANPSLVLPEEHAVRTKIKYLFKVKTLQSANEAMMLKQGDQMPEALRMQSWEPAVTHLIYVMKQGRH